LLLDCSEEYCKGSGTVEEGGLASFGGQGLEEHGRALELWGEHPEVALSRVGFTSLGCTRK